MRWKQIICKYSLLKNVLRQLLFLEIVSVRKIKNKLLWTITYICCSTRFYSVIQVSKLVLFMENIKFLKNVLKITSNFFPLFVLKTCSYDILDAQFDQIYICLHSYRCKITYFNEKNISISIVINFENKLVGFSENKTIVFENDRKTKQKTIVYKND